MRPYKGELPEHVIEAALDAVKQEDPNRAEKIARVLRRDIESVGLGLTGPEVRGSGDLQEEWRTEADFRHDPNEEEERDLMKGVEPVSDDKRAKPEDERGEAADVVERDILEMVEIGASQGPGHDMDQLSMEAVDPDYREMCAPEDEDIVTTIEEREMATRAAKAERAVAEDADTERPTRHVERPVTTSMAEALRKAGLVSRDAVKGAMNGNGHHPVGNWFAGVTNPPINERDDGGRDFMDRRFGDVQRAMDQMPTRPPKQRSGLGGKAREHFRQYGR